MILLKHLLNEIFDTARDLLLNPKYDDIPFEEGIENKYFVDFYNKDGDIFITLDIRSDYQLPKTIHRALNYYDPGTITHIVIKNSDYVPLKTITYEEWMKANSVAPKRIDLAV